MNRAAQIRLWNGAHICEGKPKGNPRPKFASLGERACPIVVILSHGFAKGATGLSISWAGQIVCAASLRLSRAPGQLETVHAEHDCVHWASRPAEPMGPDRIRGDHGDLHRGRAELPRDFGSPARAERAGRNTRLFKSALLRAAHGFAHVRCSLLLPRLHLHLRDASRQEPALGNGPDPDSRHPAVGADPGLSILHRHLLPRPLPRQYAGCGTGGDLRHLH